MTIFRLPGGLSHAKDASEFLDVLPAVPVTIDWWVRARNFYDISARPVVFCIFLPNMAAALR